MNFFSLYLFSIVTTDYKEDLQNFGMNISNAIDNHLGANVFLSVCWVENYLRSYTQYFKQYVKDDQLNPAINILKTINDLDPELKYGRDRFKDTALNLAAKRGTLELVKFLVEDMKLDTETKGRAGRNCFLEALSNIHRTQREKIVIYLNNYNPKLINSTDDTGNGALFFVAENSNAEMMRLLVEGFKMDVYVKDTFDGSNMFLVAARYGRPDIMKYLISVDANLAKGRNDFGENALNTIIMSKYYGNYNNNDDHSDNFIRDRLTAQNRTVVLKVMIDELGGDPFELGGSSKNAYFAAASSGNLEVLMYLDENFVGLNNVTAGGVNALYWAEVSENQEVIDYVKNVTGLTESGFYVPSTLEVIQHMKQNFDKDHHNVSISMGWAGQKYCNFDIEVVGPYGQISDTYYLNLDDLKYKLF